MRKKKQRPAHEVSSQWAYTTIREHEAATFLIRRHGKHIGKIGALALDLEKKSLEQHLLEEYGYGVYTVCANIDGAIRDKHHKFWIGDVYDQRRAERERALAAEREAAESDAESRLDPEQSKRAESEKLSKALDDLARMIVSMPPPRRRR